MLNYNARHNIIPGMTGWAQVNGFRGDTDLSERIRCDIYYIENWNPTSRHTDHVNDLFSLGGRIDRLDSPLPPAGRLIDRADRFSSEDSAFISTPRQQPTSLTLSGRCREMLAALARVSKWLFWG